MIQTESDTRKLKYSVLLRLSKLAFAGELDEEHIQRIPYEMIPGPRAQFRCCIYKEREIIRQRTRLAMGKHPTGVDKSSGTLIDVIPAACAECPIQRYRVTENCQRCLAKRCMEACPFGAISMSGKGAYIDPQRCRECGRCAQACPYNAIADLVRPCKRACPVGAIYMGEDMVVQIDEQKCIACGGCMRDCPFGAISDRSQILPVIEALQNVDPTVAIIAPALEGQFGPTVTMEKLRTAVCKLGFVACYDVGSGADAVALHEAMELEETLQTRGVMTTSCCPAFVSMIRKHFPQLLDKVSSTVSPMAVTARWARKQHPGAKVVFIGPCVAKKGEHSPGGPEFVLTSEELLALLEAKAIDATQCESAYLQEASKYGKGFAYAGGVSNAVMQVLTEKHGTAQPIAVQRCDGAVECKKALTLLMSGRFHAQLIEGMACMGGCSAGPVSLLPALKYKQARTKLLENADGRNILENIENIGIGEIDAGNDGMQLT